VAVESAGPYANHYALLKSDNHASTSPLSCYKPDALPAAQQVLLPFLATSCSHTASLTNGFNFQHGVSR